MRPLKDIIQERVVDKLPLVINVTEVNGLILTVCNTSFARVGTVIKDDNDVEYTVVSFVKDTSIEVDKLGFVGSVTLRKPLLMEGTPLSTNNEYLQMSNSSEDKLPLIWIVQNYTERNFGERDPREREVRATILFLDSYDNSWINDEIKDNSLSAMYSLMGQFVQVIQDDYQYFNGVETFDSIPRSRFGVETSRGHERKIIDDYLSGVELQIQFETNKLDDCCGGLSPILPDGGTVVISNSDDSYEASVNVPSGDTEFFELPDTEYNIYVNGVLNQSFALPTLKDEIININA